MSAKVDYFRERIRSLCEQRRIRIERHGERVYRLVGHGVDMSVTDLAFVEPRELEPKRKPWAIGRQG